MTLTSLKYFKKLILRLIESDQSFFVQENINYFVSICDLHNNYYIIVFIFKYRGENFYEMS